MNKFKEVGDKIKYSDLEREILEFWKRNRIFEKSVSEREGRPGFTFYEGPPTANGRPGIHHVLARTLKDLVCRYKTMRGYQVYRKAGWDTHGLPVEIEVEKKLGIKHKDEILEYGIEKFNALCRKSVFEYKDDWEEMTERIGYWVDLNDAYITCDNNYIESVWWALKKFFDAGLIYKGHKIQPYCPRCETPLSTHEVALGYEDVKDPSVYVKMKLLPQAGSSSDGENTFFLVWTTTPWTLISNVALAVGRDIDYVKVEHKGENLILARARLSVLDGDYSIIEEMKGSKLLGKRYEPIFVSSVNSKFIETKQIQYDRYKLDSPLSTEAGEITEFYESPQERHDQFIKGFNQYQKYSDIDAGLKDFYEAVIDGKHILGPVTLLAKLGTKCTVIKPLSKTINELPVEFSPETFLFNQQPVTEAFQASQAFYVIQGDFVSTEDGSGIVHIAPAFGEDDYNVGFEYGLPVLQPVNKSGNFTSEVRHFAGKFVKDADPEIIADLKDRNILYKKETITHSYPHCWRCKTPLLYYARASWYIATTKFAPKMVELNNQINWIPPEVGTGRFGNWLEENKDWALSRDRFWGTPLNIWVCQNEKCGHLQSIGSVEELRKADRYNLAVVIASKNNELDLHKPYMDAVTLTCEKCGGEMKRTPELIDVWFDSGSMPFAQYHYPFEKNEWFEKHFPADFISEGIDQTRGWFYSMHAISTSIFNSPAYKNVISHELILDKDGQKMSKSKGNAVDPFKVVAKYGADAVRWYLIASSPPYKPKLFDESGLVEVQRKFFSTLLNTYAFFTLYANIDGFTYSEQRIPVSERLEIDRWIISMMNTLVKDYSNWMDAYDITKAARAVSDFTIDQLSNWYVRRSRRRFWKGEMAKDKLSAYQTLYECLITVLKLMSPFAPFLSEELYKDLNGITKLEPHESVHLSHYPDVNEDEIDSQLEERMALAEKIVYLARAMRVKSSIRVRQPLRRIIIPVSSLLARETISQVENLILDEINVKSVMYVDDDSEFVNKGAKPNFKSIGPKFGKDVKVVAELIRSMTSKDIGVLEKDGKIDLHVQTRDLATQRAFHVVRDDVEIFSQELSGWLVESDGTLTVALDTELDEDLKREGIAREFVNRIQNLRKDAGFDVTDRITVKIDCPEEFSDAVTKLSNYIKSETLAVELSTRFGEGEFTEDVEVERRKFKISLSRIKSVPTSVGTSKGD